MKDNVYKGKYYQLSKLGSDTMTFVQTYQGYPIMNNSRARLSFNIDNGKATSYKQTMMDNIEAAKGSNSSKTKS